MANDQPKVPSWKNQGAANRPAANASRKPWQPSGKTPESGPVDPRRRFRKRLLAAGITGSLLIAAVVIVVWLWRPPKLPALVVVAPDTSATLAAAPNVYGANSAKAFAEWAGQGKDRPRLAAEPKDATTRDAWRAVLDKSNEKTVILYFAVHGAADRNGPYLWMTPADAAAVDESQKLPVKEILQRLAELPSDKQKLVIFDATQVAAGWSQGFLHNDFARALKALDAEIEKVPNLVVVCSSDDDQRSWASEEWRQTIFGHFLNEAVRGGVGKEHPRVTAAVLHDYLKKEVGNWARANRDAEQTPVVLPSASGRSRAEKLEVASIDAGNYQAPSAASAPGNGLTVPEDLKAAWETAARLADAKGAPPETAAPHAWRAYLDTLLRWEHLARAGAPADAVARQAEALERALALDLFDTDPPCLPNSLSVGPAFGVTLPAFDSAKFRELWSPLKDKRAEDVWRELVGATRAREGARGVTLLRLAAARKVLETVALPENGATPPVLARAAELLEIIDEGQPRPVETHLLLLLNRDLDPTLRPDPSLILKALNLRAEAERVAWLAGAKDGYAHADQVYRWVEKSLREADRQRQWGEDLLIPSDKPSWDKALGYLKAAEEAYARCAADAATAADALRTRDRVFSRLPYYARWVANYRGGLPDGEVERLLQLVEKVAGDAHGLAEKLEDVPENPAARLAEVKNLAVALKADLAELHRVFDTDTGALTGTVLPSNWHALDNALSVPSPILPVERRLKLLQDLRSVGRQLNEKSQTQSTPASASPFDAKRAAQRQGRVALALLGERWVEDADARAAAARGAVPFHYGDLKQRVVQPSVGAWWDSLREVGDQVGWHWRAMGPMIASDLDEAGQVELKVVPKYLARASRLGRLIDSATPAARGRAPGSEERRYWTHAMLLWQARRTIDDGLGEFAKGPTVKPYGVEAGDRYAQAAEKLILGNNPSFETRERNRRLAMAKETRALLKAPAFDLDWAKVKDLTEDRPWSIDYHVTPASGPAVGYPTLRITSAEAPLRVRDETMSRRLPIEDFAGKKAAPHERTVDFAFEKKRSETVSGQVRVDLMYRGHIFEMPTRVSLAGRPDVEWVYAPPSGKARVGIFGGKELRQGAVTLIVDRTLSMNDQVTDDNGKPVGPVKLGEAIAALERVLNELESGTMLSVGVFHGRDDGKYEPRIEWLCPPHRWGQTAKAKEEIIAKVKAIRPPDDAQTTPLTKLLTKLVFGEGEGANAFPRKSGVGFRNIVVLTDGEDNVTYSKTEPEMPGRLVRTALQDAEHDVALHLILFGLSPKTEAYARRQFSQIEDPQYFEKRYRTPGKIWAGVSERKKLAEALSESMLPKVQILRGVENGERLPNGLQISLRGEGIRRFSRPLDPGTYQLRAFGTRKLLHLEPGDRVLLEMRSDGERLDLGVPAWADVFGGIPATARADSTDGQVHLTLAKNSLTEVNGGNDLNMVATLERRSQARVEELRIDRPWFVWFDVPPRDAADGAKPRYVRVANLKDCMPPAWDVTLSPWVPERGKTDARNEPALPAVNAYWVDVFPGDPYRVTFPKLADWDTEFRKTDKDVTVDRSKVHIDGISVEDGFLYVRATHEVGKPIVVRVPGLKQNEQRLQLGELHRYYDKAGKYTARFGPIERADFTRPVTFQFYSLDSLKKVAHHARLDPEKPQPDSSARDLLPRVKAED